ncbi:hypothetical protein ABKN59_006255 [Abortiporus biennis]
MRDDNGSAFESKCVALIAQYLVGTPRMRLKEANKIYRQDWEHKLQVPEDYQSKILWKVLAGLPEVSGRPAKRKLIDAFDQRETLLLSYLRKELDKEKGSIATASGQCVLQLSNTVTTGELPEKAEAKPVKRRTRRKVAGKENTASRPITRNQKRLAQAGDVGPSTTTPVNLEQGQTTEVSQHTGAIPGRREDGKGEESVGGRKSKGKGAVAAAGLTKGENELQAASHGQPVPAKGMTSEHGGPATNELRDDPRPIKGKGTAKKDVRFTETAVAGPSTSHTVPDGPANNTRRRKREANI